MWRYILFLVLLWAICYLVLRYQRRYTAREYARKYSTKDPVVLEKIAPPEGGNYDKETLHAFKEHRGLELIRKRHEAGGYTFITHTIGGRIINTSEPENIKTIQATWFEDWSLGFRQAALGPLLGKGVFTTDGKDWEHSRALVRPNMATAFYSDLSQLDIHVFEFLNQIPRDGSTVDIQDLFFKLAFNTSSEFLFGQSVNAFTALPDSEEARFTAAFDYASSETVNRLHYGPYLFLYFNPKFTKSCKVVHRFLDSFIARSLAKRRIGERPQQYNFLEGLMDTVTDPERLRSELLNLMLAGRDTTASLLANIFYVLARKPDVWLKLDQEVATLQGKPPTYGELKQLHYLRYVMKEILRLHPVVPINSPVAVRHTILPTGGGPDHKSPIFIPKGQKVSFSPYTMFRRKDIYGPDANDFRPERWADPNFRPGWAYIPFNGGPRICLGQAYALTEAGYTVVRLVQTFREVEQRDFTPYKENVRLTASIFGGVHVGLIPRI